MWLHRTTSSYHFHRVSFHCIQVVFHVIIQRVLVLLPCIVRNVSHVLEPIFSHHWCDAASCLDECINWIQILSQPVTMSVNICFDLWWVLVESDMMWLGERRYLHVLNDSWIGLRSREYGGKNSSRQPTDLPSDQQSKHKKFRKPASSTSSTSSRLWWMRQLLYQEQ